MNFKRLIPIISPAVSAVAIIVSSITLAISGSQTNTQKVALDTFPIVESVVKEETVIEEWYLIREYEGIIGVFDRDGNLIQTFTVYVITLPKRDQTLLKNGIEIKSKGELLDLIQDYTS